MHWEKESSGSLARNMVAFSAADHLVEYIQITEYIYIEFKTEADLINKLGLPEIKMRSGYSNMSWMYIYPKLGLAYTIEKEWYGYPAVVIKYIFKPMTLDEFEETSYWQHYEPPEVIY